MKRVNEIKQWMRVKVLCVVLFLLAGGCLQAQQFSKLYFDGRPAMLFGSIEYAFGQYFVTGVTTTKGSPPYYQKALFGSINADGTVDSIYPLIDSTLYSYGIFANSLKKTADGNFFIATGDLNDTKSKAFFMKCDLSGHLFLWKEYSYSAATLFHGEDVFEIPGQGYLLIINSGASSNSNVCVIRTDLNGDILNQKFYDKGNIEYPFTIRHMMNGHYMIGAFSGKSGSTSYTTNTWLLEIDSMGNKIRDWIDTNDKTTAPNGMQQTSDSGWIIARQFLGLDIGNTQAFKGSMLKLDKDFNKEWGIDTGGIDFTAGLYDVEILPNGDYIFAGSTAVNITVDSNHVYGWILKVSKAGEILWERKYLADERFGTESSINDVDVLPNGDLLACGKLEYSYDLGIRPLQKAWILRTDSNGCVLDNCTVEMEEIDKPEAVQVQVSPNPFSSDVSIVIQKDGLRKATFTILNMLGQVVYTRSETALSSMYTQSIDLTYLSAGVYFVEVVMDGERVVREVVKE